MSTNEKMTFIGRVNVRGTDRIVGIKNSDRARHMYIIGKTGVGKSTLLEQMMVQDFDNYEGVIFMDPHGQSVEKLLKYIKQDRMKDVIYFAPQDYDRPIGLNIMEDVGYDKRHIVVSSLISAFRRIWGSEAWSDRMEYILTNTLLALLEYPNTTLLDINRMYTSENFRNTVVENIKDPQVKQYWLFEFKNYTERYIKEATPAIANKIGQFLANPLVRNIVSQPKSAFDFRDVIDQGKIVLINLSKGSIGDTNSRLLGVLFTTKIYLAALSRANITEEEKDKLPACNFYVDEFQSFASSAFSEILSEARKYKLNLIMSHQYLSQLELEIRDAVFGNAGTFVSFAVGPIDAELLETQFSPVFDKDDIKNLHRFNMYISLAVDGESQPPFAAVSLPLPDVPKDSHEEEIKETSRNVYGVSREELEASLKNKYDEEREVAKPKRKPMGYDKRKPMDHDKRKPMDHDKKQPIDMSKISSIINKLKGTNSSE